ncbi:protein of unknown function [Roseivivax lentus]|uniref:DnaJ homologue subfamily C member 28 conserved domain-containing protein n=1 Tax=Roseivivax lentus TaxID=633194 RepID=A0A1N7PJ80_9RHOB|nr:DUF1992 domain-containing protein [Roseivivax lentus]SIT10685.1 protein of unknown function [Roseivivax lentus]
MAMFPRIAEQRMQEAAEDGLFDNLKGAGQPIPDLQSHDGLDAATRAGFRIMSEAGAVPFEVSLKRALNDARAALRDCRDAEARPSLMRKLADLEMRYAMTMEQRRRGR